MKSVQFAIALLTTALHFGHPEPAADWNENDWTQYLAQKWDMEAEHRLPGGSRADLLDRVSNTIYEVDWAGKRHGNKWAEGIGQALYYAQEYGGKPGLVLLLDGDYEENYYRTLLVVRTLQKHGVEIEFRTVKVD